MWIGDDRVYEGYDYKSTAYVNNHPLAITNPAYCVDKKDAGYDFETEPEPEHAFEILTFTSAVRAERCVSNT